MASANVIVVHGLEDCDNVDFQTVFLDAVISGLASIEEIPFSQKLLVLGRPTDRLRECLSKFPGRILQRPALADKEELLHEQTMYAEAKGGIRKMAEKREPWIMQQIEGLKKREQRENGRSISKRKSSHSMRHSFSIQVER